MPVGKDSAGNDIISGEDESVSLDPVLTYATQGPSPEEERQATISRDLGIRRRLAQAEAAGPTVRQRTQSETIDLLLLQQRLGNPFSTRWIPFEQLRDMTTDLMLAFGWWTTIGPMAGADFFFQGPDAQLNAAVDEAYRQVCVDLLMAMSNDLWYGHQPLIKQFRLGRLGATYRDPNGKDPTKDLPVWSSTADALLWKAPTVLNPSHCLPMWNDDGQMIGFKFSNLPIPHFDLISAASAYGYLVIPGHEINSDYAVWSVNESELQFGCQPPDELVLTTKGYVRIGDLDPECHRLAAYESSTNKIKRGLPGQGGPSKAVERGYTFEKGTRDFAGSLVVIEAGKHGKIKVTPNHKLTVSWGRESERYWAVYLMRRDDWWRIGTTRLHHPGRTANSGVGMRMQGEKATDAWILGVFESKREALIHEHLWSNLYAIPELTFELTGQQHEDTVDRLRPQDLHDLWNQMDSVSGARRLLADKGLFEELPLYHRNGDKQRSPQAGWTAKWMIYAANLIPGLMEIPYDPGEGRIAGWTTFEKHLEPYEGPVVSLDVPPYHHYITGGLITQNSVFGSPRTSRAYRFWWSYWFRWSMADRAYENSADPPKYVYYPVDFDEFIDPDDPNQENPKVRQARQSAIDVGSQMRSGATIAFPGSFAEGLDGRGSAVHKWQAGYFDVPNNFAELDATLKIIDILKLRAWFTPEQSVVEGCLLPDTPVLCPRDHDLHPDGVPLSQIEAGQLVWAYNEQEEKFELWPVKSVHPTRVADTWRVTLDDGSEIVGTSNHPFLRRDGSWCELGDLRPGDSLMPLYEKVRDVLYNGTPCNDGDSEPFVALKPGGAFTPEFRAVGEHFGWTKRGPELGIHHKDRRHANSSPENLELLTNSEHQIEHMSEPGKREFLSVTGKQAVERLKSSMTAEEWYDYCSRRTAKGWSNRRQLPTYAERVCLDCGIRFRPASAHQTYCDSCSPTKQKRRMAFQGRIKGPRPYAEKSCERCDQAFAPTSGRQKYCDGCREVAIEEKRAVARREKALAKNNHKVVSVALEGVHEVWDIEMDAPAHCQNFVAAGVVVHNSGSRTSGGSGGGTGGARMASQLADVHEQSQQALIARYDGYINTHFIPQFIAANFPEKIGTPCQKVTRPLGQTDDQTLSQVLTLIGQVRGEVLPVDIRALLEQKNIPLLNKNQMKAEIKEIASLQKIMGPPPMNPSPQGTQGYNAGVGQSQDGSTFYYQPPERIAFSENGDFIGSLPDTPHFQDPTARAQTMKLRNLMKRRYEEQFASLAEFLKQQPTLHLAEQETKKTGLNEDQAEASAAAIISAWAASQAPGTHAAAKVVTADGLGKQLAGILTKICLAGGKSTLKSARLHAEDFDSAAVEDWVNDRVKFLLNSVDETVRDEARDWLVGELQKTIDPDVVSETAKEHFVDFPLTHSERAARTECVDNFNRGAAEACERAGVAQMQVHDASDGADTRTDAPCLARNGKFVSTAEAKEVRTLHPRCTVWLSPLSTENLSVDRVEQLPEHLAEPGKHIAYDAASETLYLDVEVDKQTELAVTLMLGNDLALR